MAFMIWKKIIILFNNFKMRKCFCTHISYKVVILLFFIIIIKYYINKFSYHISVCLKNVSFITQKIIIVYIINLKYLQNYTTFVNWQAEAVQFCCFVNTGIQDCNIYVFI